jgi:preprotein translocase subunit SecG
MELVETLVIVAHVLAAVALVALVLLQQGKGAEMGASFGAGASQTLFGSEGSGSFMTRMTSVIALVFFVSSFTLAVFARQHAAAVAEEDFVPVVEESSDPGSLTVPDVKEADIELNTDVEPETPELE